MAIESKPSQDHAVLRGVRLHLRLLIAFLLGVAVMLVLPAVWPLSTRLLTAWSISLLLYLVATARLFIHADLKRLRARAAEEDEGAVAIIFLTALAAFAMLGAIFVELSVAKSSAETRALHTALAVSTIAMSWFFVHLVFAQHYAHQYYGDAGEHAEGLKFPGKETPDHWDFLYFSLVIGMTSQVSDVAVTKPSVRRVVLLHGVLSFFFNTAVIALTVNIAAGVVG